MGRGIELVEVVAAKAGDGNQTGSKTAPRTSIQCFGDEYNGINSPHATSFNNANGPDLEGCHEKKPGWKGGWKPGVIECLFMTCICILVMMDAFNGMVVIPLVPDLANSLGQPLENALWINTSYFLANAASQTISSMLAEVFGHGPILLAAAVLSTIGTGVCGGSLNLAGIIAGRSLQGTGGGGILAASFLIISNLIPKYHQQEFTNYVFRAQVAGSIVGAILGGLFGDYATTTWPFYSSFVFCALGMLVVPFAVDLRGCGQGNTGYVCKLRRTDWLGALLILFGVGTLLIGISWGGTRFAWDEAATLVPICVGISLLLLLVAYERFWTVHPFFSSAMFKSLSTTMIHISGFIYGTIISSHLHFLPLYLTFVKYLPHALTGLGLVALVALTLPFLILAQKFRLLSHQPNLNPWILRLGWTLATISTGCLTILDFRTPTAAWIILFLICGLSHSLLTPSFIRCMFTRPFDPDSDSDSDSDSDPLPKGFSKRKIPPILLHSILRTWGMCIAIPISGTIMLNQLFWDVERRFPFPGEVSFMVEFGALTPGGERDDYVDGFRVLWPVCTGVAALGAVLGGVWGRVR